MHRLHYRAPAQFWEEALPLGNGRIGAMVYGNVSRERFGLNEDTLFFVDFMVETDDGQLTTSPSCSPENAFADPATGESVGLCEGSAMDLIIIRELFEYVLEGSRLLDDHDGVTEEIRASLGRLASPRIGRDGRLLEYGIEADEPEPTHRHNYGGIGTGGSGFGSGGGPTRNNRVDIYPMFYSAGQYNNVNGEIPGNSYNSTDAALFEVAEADSLDWEEYDGQFRFAPPNIVIMKIEWDADNGKDILSLARFLESDTLSEKTFDAMIATRSNLTTASWAETNRPDLNQADLDTITFMGIKYFVDELRIATTFEEVIGEIRLPSGISVIVR